MANITKRTNKKGETSYLIRVFIDERVDGKQTVKSMTFKPDAGMTERQIKKELDRQVIAFEDKIKNGGTVDANIKFGEYAQKWLETNKSEYAPITYTRYSDAGAAYPEQCRVKTVYERA